jgi:hypothetical protein
MKEGQSRKRKATRIATSNHHHRHHDGDNDDPSKTTTSPITASTASSVSFPIRSIDKLYACEETVACSYNCIPCAYKIGCFDVALDKEFFCKIPNQRPEQCPRMKSFQKQQQQQTKKNKNDNTTATNDNNSFLGCRPNMTILTVGDGDFSFSLGLARRLMTLKRNTIEKYDSSSGKNGSTRIIATSYETEETLRKVYPKNFDTTVQELKQLGVDIAYTVDATSITETLPFLIEDKPIKFDRIIWNFPCTAIAKGQDGQNQEMEHNKSLVRRFVHSAQSILDANQGEIYICHKTKPPFNQWNLEHVALEKQTSSSSSPPSTTSKLQYTGRIVLDRSIIPPYTPRKALDSKSFPCHDACFYVFATQDHHRRQQPQHTSTIPNNIVDHKSNSNHNNYLIKVTAQLIASIREKHIMKQSLMSNPNHDSTDDAVTKVDGQNSSNNKKQKKQQRYPLQGLVVSVSTLKGDESNDQSSTSYNYNDVCRSCQELGATVIRKAQKQNKPLVSVEWLEACRKQGQKVDTESYRLESFAKKDLASPSRRKFDTDEHDGGKNKDDEDDDDDDDDDDDQVISDANAGWTVPISIGCCCVCHENGTTKDCTWCMDCNGIS